MAVGASALDNKLPWQADHGFKGAKAGFLGMAHSGCGQRVGQKPQGDRAALAFYKAFHGIHAYAPARDFGDVSASGETGHKNQLCNVVGGQFCVAVYQAQGDSFSKNVFKISRAYGKLGR